MRKFFLTTVCACMLLTGIAQKNGIRQVMIESKFIVVANAGLDLPLGDFSQTNSVGLSGSLGFLGKIQNNVKFGLVIDENYVFGKKIPDVNDHYNGENILRIVSRALITDQKVNLIFGLETGLAFIGSGGQSDTRLTYGASIGVPLFGKTPLFGSLFHSKNHTVAKAELMLFLSPRIINAKNE